MRSLLAATCALPLLGLLAALAFAASSVGCSSSSSGGSGGSADGGGSGSADGGSSGADAGSASGVDGGAQGPVDASLDAGGSGAACSFNKDCPSAERCECDVSTGCFCHTGARGTGKNGVDTCTTGNDCASAVCVEGPASGTAYYCSDECASGAQCMGALPVCSDIAFVGKICVRMP